MSNNTHSSSDHITVFTPIHPGYVLKDKLDHPYLSHEKFSELSGIELEKLESFMNEAIPVDPDLAEKLANYFGQTINFWHRLQAFHDENLKNIILSLKTTHPMNIQCKEYLERIFFT